RVSQPATDSNMNVETSAGRGTQPTGTPSAGVTNANTETPSAGTVDANRVSQPTETPEKEKTTDSKQPNSSTNSQD
ncbi:MAG TPA: hypothetical protein DHM44_01650, partial [Flexistipes sinusarabici]|nr:hypothetical protein [Flexistipes sinusarabici]